MALERRTIPIPLSGGLNEGEDEKLFDPPAAAELRDAKWDDRGEYAKRRGSIALPATGAGIGVPSVVYSHDGRVLLQFGEEGTAVYNEGTEEWTHLEASTRPSKVLTDPLLIDAGSYSDPDIAYEPATNLVCVTFKAGDAELFDDISGSFFAIFIDAATRTIVHGPTALPSAFERLVKVISFGGRFQFFGVQGISPSPSEAAVVATMDPSAGFSFSSVSQIDSRTIAYAYLDAYVHSADQTWAHVVAGSGRFEAYQVAYDGTVGSSMLAHATKNDAAAAAILHNPAMGIVYVLHNYNYFGTTDRYQLIMQVFADDYSSVQPFVKEVLEFENPTTSDLRVALALEGNLLWAFASNGSKAGQQALHYRKCNSSGSPSGDAQVAPGMILATKGARDSLNRAVIGASYEHTDTSETLDEPQPLPIGFLLTPEDSFDAENLATVGHFGLDRINVGGPFSTNNHLPSMAAVGGEHWAVYRGKVSVNEGLSPSSLEFGYRWGLFLMRANFRPSPTQLTSAQSLSLVPGGVVTSYDGVRVSELPVAFVPNAPHSAGGYAEADLVDADGNIGSFTALPGVYAWPGSVTFPTDGIVPVGTSALLPYVTATVQYRVIFRWVDAAGNIRRTSPSAAFSRTWWPFNTWTGWETIEAGPGAVLNHPLWEIYYDADPNSPPGTKWFLDRSQVLKALVVRKPPVSTLTNDPNTPLQVEIYRTEPTYRNYDPSTGTLSDTLEGNNSFRLCGVVPVRDITGWPNLGWIEDPAFNMRTPSAAAPVVYDAGGELGAEPCPPLVDLVSTQRRLFGISGEDRNEVWYTKPLVAGYGPEWNAALTLRCGAEGGELVALAHMDDKLVLFKERAIYIVPVFSGPDSSGGGSAFQPPRQLSSDTGCVNANSVISGPWGVMFQAERGIYRLDRGLSISFVGEAAMDTPRGRTILSSSLVAAENQVRFLLDDETALVYDYRVDQWVVWDNTPGTHASTWRDAWARIQPTGVVHLDSDTYDAPDGTRPMLSITTAWLKMASLQGYQRLRQALLLGDFHSGDLTVEVGYDYEDGWDQTEFYWEEDLAALDRFQLRVNLTRQKCQSIRFRIRERALTPTTASLDTTLESALGKTQDAFNILPAPGSVTWSGAGGTPAIVTSGQADPAGGTDAWLLTDSSAAGAARANVDGVAAYTSGNALWGLVWVKKDLAATHFSEIRLEFVGASSNRLAIRLDTGETAINGGAFDEVSVTDFGDFFFVAFKHAGDVATEVDLAVYAANGFAAGFPVSANSATGSATVYGPRIADATANPDEADPTTNIVPRPSVGQGFTLSGLQLEVGIKQGSFKMVTAVNRSRPDWLELTGVAKIDLSDTSLTALETPE